MKRPSPFAPRYCAVVDDDLAAAEDGVDVPVDLVALPRGVVHVHVVGLAQADRRVTVRVVDDDVGIRSGLDDALLAVHAEHAGRGRAGQLDPALEGQLTGDDALVHEVHAVLDRADAVRDLAEVARCRAPSDPSCRTGSGRWRPSAGRWCAGPATCGPGGPRPGSAAASSTPTSRPRSCPTRVAAGAELVFEREVEVLRAGLAEHVLTLVARPGELLDGLLRADVHDVERGVR